MAAWFSRYIWNPNSIHADIGRQIFRKVKAEHSSMESREILRTEVRALNDTSGPNGLVPTLLLFGITPRVPLKPVAIPKQVLRMKALNEARIEISRVVAASPVSKALSSKTTPATIAYIRINDKVLVFCDE